MNKIYYKEKKYLGTGDLNDVSLSNNKTSEEVNVVDMIIPDLYLPNYQKAGFVDKDLYDAVVAFGWQNDVLEQEEGMDMKLLLKKLLVKLLNLFLKLTKISTASASLNSTYVSGGSISFTKVGGTVQVGIGGLAFNSFSGRQVIGTIPEGFRPPGESYVVPNNMGGTAVGAGYYLMFEANGDIKKDGTGAAHTFGWATGTYVLGGGVT